MKNKTILALLMTAVGISSVYADDPDSVANFICDAGKNQLRIETFDREVEDINVPYPRIVNPDDTTISMRGLMWAAESSPGEVVWKKRPINRTCMLGGKQYIATLSGYKYNENVNGRCGAGSPVLLLTIHQNKNLIIDSLIFNNSCESSAVIESVTLKPTENVAVVEAIDENEESSSQTTLSLESQIDMQRVFSGQ